MKVVKPIPLDRNGVRLKLEEAIEQGFDAVYIVGLKGKQAHFIASGLDSNLEMIGALEMCKMQIYETSGGN